jgi:hypothetical protein
MATASTESRPKPLSGGARLLASAMEISRGLISPHASALKKVVRLPPKARAPSAAPLAACALLHQEPDALLQASAAAER